MSLHQLANHMSAQGRGPDSTLVHMSPREVSGLQSLAMAHGGTLTINPETGLPEAGFLDSLMPTLLGGAATYFTGGAINPAVIAAAVGGITALTSKDLGKGLMAGLGAYGGSGIVSGLAGFGAEALGSEAATAALPSGYSSASEMAGITDAASNAAQTNASYYDKLSRGVTEGFKNPMGALSAVGDGSKLKGAAMFAGPAMAAFSAVDEPKTSMPEKSKTAFIRSYYKDPETGRQMANPAIQAEDWGTRNFGERIYAADGGLMALASGGQTAYDYLDRKRSTSMDSDIVVDDTPPKPSLPPSGSNGKGSYVYNKDLKKWVWTPDAKPVVPVNPGVEVLVGTGGLGGNDGVTGSQGSGGISGIPGLNIDPVALAMARVANLFGSSVSLKDPAPVTDKTFTPTQAGIDYAGESGKSSWGKSGNADQDIGPVAAPSAPAPDAGPSSGSESSGGYGEGLGAGYDKAKGGYIGHYAQGGLGSLGGYSDGGRLLRGPGDGVSDSIPATVGGRQPARLADGEFVVPARIVSELGNGSTEAGARALYKMMDRIQANRRKTTGKNSVAVNSKSHKYLPA